MDLASKSYSNTIRVSQQALSPITTPGNLILGSHSYSSDTSFPIIAIAVIGILATGFLLVSYYIFVIKCCLNRHCIDLLRRFSLSRRRPEDALTAAVEHRGLDESVIRSIPIFQFKKINEHNNNGEDDERSFFECVNEHFKQHHQWQRHELGSDPSSTINDDEEDYVVIELSNNDNNNTSSIDELSNKKKQARTLQKGTSMGAEWIDSRDKNEEFAEIQPIRRSISMDSSADRQLYLVVQEAIRQKRQVNEVSTIESCSSSRMVRRSFFSFGHGGGSKNAVLPVYLEP
ncbi:RING-H2 finger protein ATL16 [Hibiscus syriacus]|uniref:RING-type E3 ubiquitin transferase n=1 Tax=Hibiscus syriacus TaxID=106335 RepID=A0A6A3D2U3_HIBSY|nr:RING-H2 finger protein ATL16 [Hibiscus syriacus]